MEREPSEELTPERMARFQEVAARRQLDLTVVLENVHDPHNIGAVLRTCDSVGIREIFILYSEDHLYERGVVIGKRTSAGTRKWVDVHLFRDAEACFQEIRSRYERILGTHLTEQAANLYDLDLTGSVALVFGNERDGLSQEVLEKLDGNFLIPQAGMVQSLNISVACAVTVYEAYRQRHQKGLYDGIDPAQVSPAHADLLQNYFERHLNRYVGSSVSTEEDEGEQ